MKFEEEINRLNELIKQGNGLINYRPSLSGHSRECIGTERDCANWVIQTENFLSCKFNKNYANKFTNFFGTYPKYGILLNDYKGDVNFVKEDVERAVGYLEGILESLKKRDIQKRNKISEFLLKLWYEIKPLLSKLK